MMSGMQGMLPPGMGGGAGMGGMGLPPGLGGFKKK
jgi:signal recognition particle subunit SRP54